MTLFEQIKEFLRTPLIVTKNIYIDLWSIVHFITGYIMYSIFRIDVMPAIILLIAFEVLEPVMEGLKREHPVDTPWDIAIGIAGYFVARGGMI